ncbi:MAG: methyltransferase [Alphaproteobacteria bacterium]|nr:methyltransferase [Alphaproteobacteria bacterium]
MASAKFPHAQKLQDIVAGEHRSVAHKARDAARNTLDMYAFFGISPEMTIVDIWPTTGWTTEILAPFVRDSGTLVAPHFAADHKDDLCRRQRAEFERKLAADPSLYDQVEVADFGRGLFEYAAPESADMVITLRNFHNWMWGDYVVPVLQSFLRALKRDGVLALEEHRGDPDKPQDPSAKSLYVRQDYVIEEITSQGFIFEGSSEINANAKDTKNHPKGALSLPPNYWGVEDRTPYKAIGESDRMLLKFRKS